MTVFIDLNTLYSYEGQALISSKEDYKELAKHLLADETEEVILTGKAPIWLYLMIALSLKGLVRVIRYDSPTMRELEVS